MPKILFTIALIFVINYVLFSQSGWIWQNPLPQGNTMSDLQFVNSTTAYAMCFNTVMKTTNAGNNWSIYYTNHNQNNTSLQFINETTGFVVSDSGIVLKTVNGGVNWSVLYDFHQAKFHKIYFSDVNTGYLLRYNNYGYRGTTLYRTSNSGLTWSGLLNDSTIDLNDIKFSDLQTGYFGGHLNNITNSNSYLKIFKTTNGGLSIDSIYTGFIFPITSILIKNNIIFIYGGNSFPIVSGLNYSTNSGLNWITTDIRKSLKDISYFDPSNLYATTPSGGGTQYLYKSTNNGLNWFSIGSDLIVFDIEFIYPSAGVGVGGNGGVYRTTNSGVNWNSQFTQLAYYIWEVDFSNTNTGYAADDGGLLKTTNGGINWIKIFSRALYRMDFIDANTGYCSGTDSLYKTTNGGLDWTKLNYGFLTQLNEIHFINNNTGYILANNLKKTTDGGLTWLDFPGYGGYYSECLYFYNEMLGFIGSYNYQLGWRVCRTTNGGVNWDYQTIPTVDDYIYDFYFVNSSTGFFTTTGRIFKTTNSGNNWFEVYEYTDSFGYWSALWSIQFLNETVGYVTASQGKVLKTTDAGNTWKIYQSIANFGFYNMHFTDVNTGYFVGGGGVIVKTTNGCGDPIGIEPISNNIPESFELYQNYPNPFNPVTTIRFSIPNSTNGKNELTSLRVYDMLGKELTILIDELLSPGEYEITWDARNYPSGIYFCSLVSGNFAVTSKMVLVK